MVTEGITITPRIGYVYRTHLIVQIEAVAIEFKFQLILYRDLKATKGFIKNDAHTFIA